MSFKNFVNKIKDSFDFENTKAKTKKKELKNILKLLKKRKEKLGKSSAKKQSKEDIKIISLQIKKCEKLLSKLES